MKRTAMPSTMLVTSVLFLAVAIGPMPAQFPEIDPITLKPAETSKTSSGSGLSGRVYRVGGAVKPPKAISFPDPEYTKEARKAKRHGTVILWMVVGADGVPRDIKVARSLDAGLDQKAIEAVRKWRFQPATKDGAPVAVQINVEIDFKLY